MTEAVVLLAVGVIVGWLSTRALAGVLASPVLERENHRGRRLPTASGLCLVVAVVFVEAGRTVVDRPDRAHAAVFAAAVAFGLLGLADDVLGDGDARGLRGHVGAVLRGRWTTGFLKLAAGAAVGLVLAGIARDATAAQRLVDGAVIALAANVGNLFDRAPGRTVKWAIVASIPVVAIAGTGAATGALAPVIGAAAALLPDDLRERSMLGDTGSNALGAALGIAAVVALGTGARVGVAVGLLVLTLVSEVASFSRIIAATPPLRAFDRLGRLP